MKNEKKKTFPKKEETSINNKGITLIVLVITLIVMMILAGVSIGGLTGGDAILNKAQYSVNEYEETEKEEKQKLNEITESFSNEDEGKQIEDNFDEVMNETIPF